MLLNGSWVSCCHTKFIVVFLFLSLVFDNTFNNQTTFIEVLFNKIYWKGKGIRLEKYWHIVTFILTPNLYLNTLNKILWNLKIS